MIDGGLYREEHEQAIYLTYDNTKYWIHTPQDFDAMGFQWGDVICVPDGYMDGVSDEPPDKTLIGEFGTAPVYVYLNLLCDARFHIPNPDMLTLMIQYGYANDPVRWIPPGEILDYKTIPDEGCHLKEHDDPAQYITCVGPVPYSYSKWHIFSELVLPFFGLDNSTFKSLWLGALSGIHTISRTNLRADCPNADNDVILYRQIEGEWQMVIDQSIRWSNLGETFNGTNPNLRCDNTPVPNDEPFDAWPPDANDDQVVDGSDVLQFGQHFPSSIGSPNYDRRFDFDTSGLIDGADVLKFGVLFLQRCWPPAGDGPELPEEPSEFEPVEVAIDANVEGDSANSANYLGSREECGAVSSKAVASGTSSGDNSATTLNDKGAAFGAGLTNYGVRITDGTGAGQIRRIEASSETQLVVSPAWDTVPDDGSAYEVVATVQADITVESLAGFDADAHKGGVAGFGLNLHFDPETVAVIGVNPDGDSNTILAAGGTRIPFDVIDSLPATGGNMRIDMLDLSQTIESGSGVLVRLVLMPLASGGSTLSLSDVVVFEAGTTKYEIGSALGAEIRVDSGCDS